MKQTPSKRREAERRKRVKQIILPDTLESFGQLGLNTILRLTDDSGGFRMNHYLAKEGVFVLLSSNNTAAIRIQPPLIISNNEIDQILEALNSALSRMN